MFWSQDANHLIQSTSTFVTGINYNIGAVYNGTNNIIYINGTQDNITSPGSLNTRNAANPRIGHSALLSSGNFRFNGRMDELRISNVGRSAGWISTTNKNQNTPNTFYSVTAQESNPDFNPPQVSNALFFGFSM